MEVNGDGKHSNLLQCGNKFGRKKFLSSGPNCQIKLGCFVIKINIDLPFDSSLLLTPIEILAKGKNSSLFCQKLQLHWKNYSIEIKC